METTVKVIEVEQVDDRRRLAFAKGEDGMVHVYRVLDDAPAVTPTPLCLTNHAEPVGLFDEARDTFCGPCAQKAERYLMGGMSL